MTQFTQIRERFLADARQHLFDTDTQACNCHFDCCRNGSDSSSNESAARSGKEDI